MICFAQVDAALDEANQRLVAGLLQVQPGSRPTEFGLKL